MRARARSAAAFAAGFAAIVVLSLSTDQLFHALDIYPPWGAPMQSAELNLLALSYRLVYGVFGGWLTARLAPERPLRHAVVLGVVGTALSLLGVVGAASANLGPLWYPIALVVTALPTCWLGGRLAGPRAM